MANETNSKLKIISEWFVRPNREVEESKYIHYLSANDLFHLPTSYMHRGLLYTKPASLDVNALVHNLKHSLSLALVDFYPLAGRLETVNYEGEGEGASSVQVACDIGPGVRFIHADGIATQVRVSDIVTSYETISPYLIWSLFDAGDPGVVNHDGHTRALVSVQVTDLVDGVFIGFTMNHTIGDGTSFWLFVKSLSKIFMDNGNNDIIKAVVEYGYQPISKVSSIDPSEFISRRRDVDPRLTIRIFNFTVGSIARLKAQARETNHNPISSFQALSALIWYSISRALKQPLESDMDCWIMSDIRSKLDPPLPENQFGNLVHPIRVTSKMKDLMTNGLGWASLLVHKAIVGPDYKVIKAKLKARNESKEVVPLWTIPSSFGNSNPPLIFSGSMRFDIYGSEFGLGKAVAIRPGYSSWKDGAILVNPGREGGGSASLHVCLLSEIMIVLESDDQLMSYVS